MTQEAPQSSYEEAYVDVNGARVHYLHAGTGPPMLLMHGLVGSSENWRNNISALAQNASVYAIDLVNMGKSQRIDGLDVSLRATAHRIVAIMDALGLAAADIVAHSHGGSVALMLAALYPARVRRLILFAPANPYSRSSDRMVRVYSSPFGIVLGRMIPYFPAPVQRLALGEGYASPDRVADHSLQEIVDGLRCPATLRHVLSIIRCWFSEMDRLRYALRRVTRIPILLVWGDHDGTVSLASGVRLKRKLHAKLLVVPGGGHTVFEERPEEANQIMLEWFAHHPLATPSVAHTGLARPRRVSRFAAKTHTAPPMRRLSPETSGD